MDVAADSQQDEEEAATEKVSVPICEYFHRGKCTFGDNCVKSHDPLPLYKSDLKNVVLRTAAEVAAEKRAAGTLTEQVLSSAGGTKVKTELVKIVKNRTSVPTAAAPPELRREAAQNTAFVRAGVSFMFITDFILTVY